LGNRGRALPVTDSSKRQTSGKREVKKYLGGSLTSSRCLVVTSKGTHGGNVTCFESRLMGTGRGGVPGKGGDS